MCRMARRSITRAPTRSRRCGLVHHRDRSAPDGNRDVGVTKIIDSQPRCTAVAAAGSAPATVASGAVRFVGEQDARFAGQPNAIIALPHPARHFVRIAVPPSGLGIAPASTFQCTRACDAFDTPSCLRTASVICLPPCRRDPSPASVPGTPSTRSCAKRFECATLQRVTSMLRRNGAVDADRFGGCNRKIERSVTLLQIRILREGNASPLRATVDAVERAHRLAGAADVTGDRGSRVRPRHVSRHGCQGLGHAAAALRVRRRDRQGDTGEMPGPLVHTLAFSRRTLPRPSCTRVWKRQPYGGDGVWWITGERRSMVRHRIHRQIEPSSADV